MANTIQLLRSTVAGNKPDSLASGQIAINERDAIIYYRAAATGAVTAFPSGSLDGGVYPLVTISAQPSATSAAAGAAATFAVTATATQPTTTLTYQWQQSTDNSTWSSVSGATGSTLTLSSVSSGQNNYYYRCQLTAALSVINSSSAQLTVTSAFTPTAVLLTSGTSYSVPANAANMKAWVVGGGGNRLASVSAYGGGAGGCAYKTWSVSGGQSVSYSIGSAATTLNTPANGGNTSVTFGGVTITGNGGNGASTSSGGSYSGGDGGATGGSAGALIGGNSGAGGAVGGNGTAASCKRIAMTDVSGLLAAAALAGATTTEGCVSGSPAIGSGGFSSKYSAPYNAGYGGGGARDTNLSGNGALAGGGFVLLYFT
jgi:hypothetical protein